MEHFTCDLCGARPFRHRAALSTHQKTCIGNKRPRLDEHYAIGSTSTTVQIPDSPAPIEVEEPQGTHGTREYFSVDVDEPLDDVLDVEMEEFFQKNIPRDEYDSTFSLVNWARTLRKGEGLSNDALNRLFNEVLLHQVSKWKISP